MNTSSVSSKALWSQCLLHKLRKKSTRLPSSNIKRHMSKQTNTAKRNKICEYSRTSFFNGHRFSKYFHGKGVLVSEWSCKYSGQWYVTFRGCGVSGMGGGGMSCPGPARGRLCPGNTRVRMERGEPGWYCLMMLMGGCLLFCFRLWTRGVHRLWSCRVSYIMCTSTKLVINLT